MISKIKPKKGYKFEKWLFNNDLEIPEEWEVKKINDVFEILITGTNSRNELNESGSVRYIHYGDIHKKWTNAILDCDSEKIPQIDEEKVTHLPLLKNGDLIIADASEDYAGSGASCLLKNVKNKKIVSGLHTVVLRSKDDEVSSDFIIYLTTTNSVKRQIVSYVTGTSVYGLSKKNLKKIQVPFPKLPEQEKITSILSNIDKLIKNQQQVIEKTWKLKQGLLQKLFKEGIKDSKSKLCEIFWNEFSQIFLGSIPDRWEIFTIKDLVKKGFITEFQDGNHAGLYPKNEEFGKNGRPFITANQLDNEGFLDLKGCKKLSEEYCKKLRIGFCKSNDVLFSHNATVGRVSIIPEDSPNCIVGTSVTYYRLNPKEIDNKFFSLVLSSDFVKRQYTTEMDQSTRQQFSILKQETLKIFLPSIDEQRKISSKIWNVHLLYKQEKQYKEKLENIKRGLMEKILSGEVRVKI